MMEELLSQVKSLSSMKQRAVAAVVGCIVADAAGKETIIIIYYSNLVLINCTVIMNVWL